MQEISDADKLNLLVNHIDASVYELISEATTYNDTVEILAIMRKGQARYLFNTN